MHLIKIKITFTPFLLLMIVMGASSTRHQNSAWNNIVTGFTALAENCGLEEANQQCIEYLRDDNTCMKQWKAGKLWRVVEENKIPILECNMVSMETTHHVCQLRLGLSYSSLFSSPSFVSSFVDAYAAVPGGFVAAATTQRIHRNIVTEKA